MDPSRPSQPSPRRRVLGLLVRGPLGCLSFLAGAAVVTIVLFPPACSSTLTETLETQFGERFRGRLELDDPWLLALYGTQRIERVALLDEDGAELASGSFRAPHVFEVGKRWLDVGERPGPGAGPLELALGPIGIVQHADGSTNLGRALRGRDEAARGSERTVAWDGIVAGYPFGVGAGPYVRVRVAGLTWENEGTLRRGAPIEVGELTGMAVVTRFVQKELFQLDLSGELVGGGHVRLSYTLEDVWGFLRGEHAPFGILTVELAGAPAETIDLLAGTGGGCAAAFGPRVDELALVLRRTTLAASEARLVLRSPQARVELSGVLRHDTGTLVAGDEGRLTADFALGTWWTEHVLAGLLPLVHEWRAAGDGGRGHLAASAFVLPLDGDPARLSGSLRFDLGEASYEPTPAFVAVLPAVDRPPRFPAAPTRIVLEVRDGEVAFEELSLAAAGERLVLNGRYHLADGAVDLGADLPASLMPDPERRRAELDGTRHALELSDLAER